MAPYAAHLRVYEPLEAFDEPERSHWAEYAAALDPGTTPAGAALLERRRALGDLLATPPLPAPPRESGEAYVRTVDDAVLVCPAQTRLRSWEALPELRAGYPAPVLDAFWPRLVLDQAEADAEQGRALPARTGAHVRTSLWHVPMRWFVLFAHDERTLVPPPGDEIDTKRAAGAAELYYRTPMVEARRRTARALRTLRETLEEGQLITSLEVVGRWLEEFHPRSLVELDFGGLTGLIPYEDLAAERTALDVTQGIAALAEGDGLQASESYRRISEWWRPVRALEHAS
jgi:hypothetical protein